MYCFSIFCYWFFLLAIFIMMCISFKFFNLINFLKYFFEIFNSKKIFYYKILGNIIKGYYY